MSIKYALLGLLSISPATGYDLKKLIEDSPAMYWSGNNNQIYKALLELHSEGFISGATEHRDALPVRRIYSITDAGLEVLRVWAGDNPELPEIRKPFLIQIGWADMLSPAQLADLISGYEDDILGRLMFYSEKARRAEYPAKRTARECFLWRSIYDNPVASYKAEYEWIQKLRSGLYALESVASAGTADNVIKTEIHSIGTDKYVECVSSRIPLRTEQDALDLVVSCGENDTVLLMLNADALSPDFFSIATGVAGRMLQKFINYHITTALLISTAKIIKGRFADVASESAKGDHFKIFESRKNAEEWLVRKHNGSNK